VAFLFDTDAVSEVLRRRPTPAYVRWLETISRADQFTSAIVVGELYKGAYRSANANFHIEQIESKVLPALTVLAYDTLVAKVYGRIDAHLHRHGSPLADADLQIAATALHHGLELVTGNVRHFERVPGLAIARVLAESRR
jgi:predicted nucleic acid-binding protein